MRANNVRARDNSSGIAILLGARCRFSATETSACHSRDTNYELPLSTQSQGCDKFLDENSTQIITAGSRMTATYVRLAYKEEYIIGDCM